MCSKFVSFFSSLNIDDTKMMMYAFIALVVTSLILSKSSLFQTSVNDHDRKPQPLDTCNVDKINEESSSAELDPLKIILELVVNKVKELVDETTLDRKPTRPPMCSVKDKDEPPITNYIRDVDAIIDKATNQIESACRQVGRTAWKCFVEQSDALNKLADDVKNRMEQCRKKPTKLTRVHDILNNVIVQIRLKTEELNKITQECQNVSPDSSYIAIAYMISKSKEIETEVAAMSSALSEGIQRMVQSSEDPSTSSQQCITNEMEALKRRVNEILVEVRGCISEARKKATKL